MGRVISSHNANKYGIAYEYHLAEPYRVDLEWSSWHDGMKAGTPGELKAAKHEPADGQPDNFKIYEKCRGCQGLKTMAIATSGLPLLPWHGGGSHRDSRQAKLAIEGVF